MIEHGRYMAIAGDCTACHTAPGGQPFAGGGALETPFGTLLAPNITPDVDNRDRRLDRRPICQRVQKRHRARRHPSLPGDALHLLHEDDARGRDRDPRLSRARCSRSAIWCIANQLPFPFNQRETMVGWNELYFTSGEFKPDPGKSAEWNRGAYLVEGRGALRPVPHAEERDGRRRDGPLNAGRRAAGLVRAEPDG